MRNAFSSCWCKCMHIKKGHLVTTHIMWLFATYNKVHLQIQIYSTFIKIVTYLIESHIGAVSRSDSNTSLVISNEHMCLCFLDAITTTYLSPEWVYHIFPQHWLISFPLSAYRHVGDIVFHFTIYKRVLAQVEVANMIKV